DHCPEGGYCKASPKCRPKGQSIWGDSGAGGPDCQKDSDCVGGQVCGFRLFDFSDRINSSQVGSEYDKVTGTSPKDRRGYCHGNVKKGCTKKADCTNNQDCDGYGLEAEGKP